MATVCETCGDVGYEDLLLSCSDCKCAMHQYCLAKVLFDGSSLERWFCNQCLLRCGEVTYEGSLHKASNQAYSSSAVHQESTTSVESTKETWQYRNHKNRLKRSKSKSHRKKYSSSKNSLLRKHAQERSDMRPVGDKANRVHCNASNISCASGKTLHSCEVIAMEISKAAKDENQQVEDEHSVHTINNDCVASLLTRIDESNLQKPLKEFEPPPGAAEQLNPTKDSNCMSSGNVEIEYPKGCCVTQISAMEMQNEPSTLLDWADSSSSETTLKQDFLLDASDTVVELSDTVQNYVKNNPVKRTQLIVLDGDDDGEDNCVKNNPLKPRQLIVLDDDDDAEDNCVKNNPLKQRQLIVLDDDDDGEDAADVKSNDFNHRYLECDGSLSKHRIETEDYVEGTAHMENLNGQNLSAVKLDMLIPESSEITQPVKKLRRYIEVNEDDEDGEVIVGTSNVECARNHVLKLTSETLVAKDRLLQSRIEFDSESANQQRCMHSQPQCESPDNGTSVVKHAFHVEDRLLTEHSCEARNGATKATLGEGIASPHSNSPFVKLNLGFMQLRSDPKLHASEGVDHQEGEQNFTRPSADLRSAATTAKSVFSVDSREVPPTTQLFGFVAARTPRAQQLIQEMVSEGALLFSAADEIVTVGSTVGNDTEAEVHLTPDSECPPVQERCQSIGFVPLDDDVASDACLELFPVRQEHIGWTPRLEASKEVDLDLSLSARSGVPLGSFL